MAEVAAPASSDLKVLSERKFEVVAPENVVKDLAPADGTYATTKEEEWVTKKKTELTTTRQIETRVKRQVLLEDGKVVDDSGPIVTTNTTEDTEKQETQQTEHRTTGKAPPEEEGWVAAPGPEGTVKEVHERKVHSREQTDERTETEQVLHQGDISDNAYQAAVQASPGDLRLALQPEEAALVAADALPRVVHQSTKSTKVVDTADSVERSQLQPDGRLVTETRRTTEHEETRDHSEPDDDADATDAATNRAVTGDDEEETLRQASHRFTKTKDQEFVEYLADGVKVGEEMRYQAETTEGERKGDANVTVPEWDSLSTRLRRMRRQGTKTRGVLDPATPLDRTDALTKKPLDLEQEEETRKAETNKWLEHHFGSDSRSSKGSLEDEVPPSTHGTSYINVTMKSRPIVQKVPVVMPVVNGMSMSPAVSSSPVPVASSSSRVFVSSPVPEDPVPLAPPRPAKVAATVTNGAGGYFQGVADWSERNQHRELKTTVHQPERIQVLPTGPNHTFTHKPLGYVEKTTVYKTSSSNSRSSPYPGSSHANPDRSLSYMNGSLGRTSPYTNDRHSPFTGQDPSSSPFGRVQVESSHFNGNHLSYKDYRDLREPSSYNGLQSTFHHQDAPHSYEGPHSPPTHRRDASPLPPREREREREHLSKSTPTSHGLSRTPGGSSLEEDGLQQPARRRSPTRLRFSDREEREGEDSYDGYRGGYGWERSERAERAERVERAERTERSGGRNGRDEPRPDYSPDHDSPSPSSDHVDGKRLYRRPRITVELPRAASPPPPPPAEAPAKQSKHGGFGESFRKLVGKFRASSAERKRRKAAAQAQAAAAGRRSPSPRQGVGRRGSGSGDEVDANGDVVGAEHGAATGAANGGLSPDGAPVVPPRLHRQHLQQRLSRNTQTAQTNGNGMHQRRFYLGEDPFGGSIYGREREYDGVKPVRRGHRSQRREIREEDDMNRANVSVTTSSSLGRLSKSTSRLVGSGDRTSPTRDRSAQTLPRKLYDEHAQTSRLKRQVYQQQQHRNGITTSKPHSNSMINVSIINTVTPPSSGTFTKTLSNGVSTGPAKPARTYRTNLSRSKSFNVYALGDPVNTSSFAQNQRESSLLNKSTSHLHRLDETPPPLKSPSILASISRSQRDLSATDSVEKEETSYSRRQREEPAKYSRSTNNLLSNGYTSTTTSTNDAKKRTFMRELMDRAPELYRTLHGDDEDVPRARSPAPASGNRIYSSTPLKNGHNGVNGINGINGTSSPSGRVVEYSNSFKSSSTNATPPDRGFAVRSPLVNGDRVTSPAGSKSSFGSGQVGRRGSSSNDDYSETVRITSKSDDPLRPSVTNTVQSFSKKTVPTKSGLSTETIQSTETHTVTKSSRFRPAGEGLRYLENGHAPKYASPLLNGSAKPNGSAGGVVIEVRPSRK